MIYLAGIYVAICGAQFLFHAWRDLKETKRRESADGMSRRYAEQAQASDARMAKAIEGFREELASLRFKVDG
jgi:hypothetical protein